MNIFEALFPTTYMILLIGLVIGFIIALLMFGTISVFLFFLLVSAGVIRIKPIIDFINTCIQWLFPNICKQLRTNIAKSFPVKVTHPLPNMGIYLIHPHGMFNISQAMHIGTKYTAWPERNIKGTVLDTIWNIPFSHEFLESCVRSNYEDMKKVIDTRSSLIVCVGGISEMKRAQNNVFSLKLKGRKGVFKLALETGTHLVPVLVYGENEIFQPMKGVIIEYLTKIFGYFHIPMCLPTFESIYKTLNLIREPYDIKIRTFIGEAIPVEKVENPTGNHISILRDTYIKSLIKLYDTTRPKEYPTKITFF